MRRLRLGRRKEPVLATHIGDDMTVSTGRMAVLVFVLKRGLLVIAVAVPAFYVLHLALLAIYSRVLFSPHGHQWEPPGVHGPFDLTLSGPPQLPEPGHAAPGHYPPDHPHHESSPYSQHLFTNRPADAPLQVSQPPTADRLNDISNTFENFTHVSECHISSLDLHLPIHPLCDSRASVLDAMSFGGRPGFDQPFIPLGCDFRWFSTTEICEILGRFSHIFIIGDSLQRMVVTALYVLLRENLGYGGVAEWDFRPAPESEQNPFAVHKYEDCKCEAQWTTHECSHSPVRLYTDAHKYSFEWNRPRCAIPDPDPTHPFQISYHELQQYPVGDDDFLDVTSVIKSQQKPARPYAFIFSHALWNDVSAEASTSWLDAITANVTEFLPWLPRPAAGTHYPPSTRGYPRLFLTPNAAGVLKAAQHRETQGSEAIAGFEREMRAHLAFRDVDMLGLYNMSVQTSGGDGTHVGGRANLLKAMMVLNWLDWVGREEAEGNMWSGWGEGKENEKSRADI